MKSRIISSLKLSVQITLTLAVLLLSSSLTYPQETILFSTDFESDNGGFTHTGVIDEWEWGTPVFGDGVIPHTGTRVWGTDLDGRLNFLHDGSLTSPVFTLPSITSTQRIYISFYSLVKIDCMSDRGTFYVSDDGADWEKLADLFYTMEMGFDDVGNVREFGIADWKKYVFDVSKYAGGDLLFRFHAIEYEGADYWWGAPPHDMAGMYIDDISIILIDGVKHSVQFSLEGWEDPANSASCPWLVCWNGSDWEKENDVYSTGRYPSNEFTDYLMVENTNLVEFGDYLRLRLSALEEEHSYTDRVALIVVDHPEGVEVGCDDEGNILTYSDVQLPIAAQDQNNVDVLTLISAKDGYGFAGFNDDYIDLDFSSIPIVGSAKLVINAQGFLEDMSRDRAPLTPTKVGIFVQTKDASGAWQNRGYFNPRFMSSTKVFDLSGFLPDPSGSHDVRIRMTSCHNHKYHLVDFVGLGTSQDPGIEILEVYPRAAEHSVLGDALGTILNSDNDRVLMNPGEEMVLDFDFPLQNLPVRDYIFVCEGYYIPAPNTFFIFTWDGDDWVLRDAKSYTAGYSVDEINAFDLSLFLPDPDGEYKVRIWQDYRWEEAEIDYVEMVVDGITGTLEHAYNYEHYPYTDECLSEISLSDNDRLVFVAYDWSWLEPEGTRGRTRIVEARFTGLPVCLSIPIVQSLDIGGNENIYNITDPNPPIEWDFHDANGDLQTEFAIQVWTGAGATGENLWNYTEVSSNTSVIYNGDPLIPGNSYFLNVRVWDSEPANCWSAWSEIKFRMYCEDCEPPVILRTPATIDLSSISQAAGNPLTIEAWITDNTSVESAKLHYRITGSADFSEVSMTNISGDLYSGTIPGGIVLPPGVDYYIWASDGVSSTTDPFTNPAAAPYQIPVFPNEAPVIVHDPVTEAPCGRDIAIWVQVTDNTNYVAEVSLHCRITGDFIYTIVPMGESGGTYSGTIPSSYTMGTSMEYFISAGDNYGVFSYSGRFDAPHIITLTGTCNIPPEVTSISATPCYEGEYKPAFSWEYYDPEDQLQSEYEVEVWSGKGGTGARLWNPPAFAGSEDTITYAGASLQEGNCYFFRVKVRDGVLWGEWAELQFCCKVVDVGIDSSDIFFSLPCSMPEDTIIIHAAVHCDPASDPISSVKVRFYDGDPDITLHQINGDQMISNMLAGDVDTVQIQWVVPDTLPHNIYVRVDPDHELEEYNESNNEAFKSILSCTHPFITIPPDTCVYPEKMVCIPVYLDSLPPWGVYSAQMVLHYDAAVLEAISAETQNSIAEFWGEPTYNIGTDQIAIAMAGATPLATTGVLVWICFNVVGQVGDSTLLEFKDDQVILNDSTFMAREGVIRVCPEEYEICGQVRYCLNDEPVDNTQMIISGGKDDTVLTDADGIYKFEHLLAGLDYCMGGEKVNDDRGAICAFDASMVLRYVVGLKELSGCQMIAGDVTGNCWVNAYDASFILKHVVGLITQFPIGRDWKFIPDDFDLDTLNWCIAPDSMCYDSLSEDLCCEDRTTIHKCCEDWKGILYGDVSGNWSDVLVAGGTHPEDVLSKLVIKEIGVNPGEKFIVPIEVKDVSEVYATELSLTYDNSLLSLEDVVLGELLQGYYFEKNLGPGEIRLALAGASPIQGSGKLIYLTFKVLPQVQEGITTQLEVSHFCLNETSSGGFAFNINIGADKASHPLTFGLFQNNPNPFNPETEIGFVIPSVCRVEIKIYNVVGQLVKVYQGEYPAGTHQISWDGTNMRGENVGSGIYFYRMEAGSFVQQKKMVLMR